MPHVGLKALTACGMFGMLLIAGPAFSQDGRALKLAQAGVQLAGYNYDTYAKCGAPADELTTFKDKSRARFPAAGAGFDAVFAAGQADGKEFWAKAVADLGSEDKVRASVCPNALQHLQTSLTRK